VRVNLGSGSRPIAGWLNVDRAAIPGVDYVHDLDVAPWPFAKSAEVEQIAAIDVFEHVADAVMFMTECHRLLATGRMLFIQTPHYRSRDAFTDPTHRRFPTEHTFDYWIPGTVLHSEHNAAYGGVSFAQTAMRVESNIQITLTKIGA
jgi:predicted SAM-dependent methyltransferase